MMTICKPGHSVGKLVTIEAVTTSERWGPGVGNGGGSGGKEQGDERYKRSLNSPQREDIQIREQGSAGGAKLHDRENFQRQGAWCAILSKISHSSGNNTIPSSPGVCQGTFESNRQKQKKLMLSEHSSTHSAPISVPNISRKKPHE